MLTSGFAPGAEPIALPPDGLVDLYHCAGCNDPTNGTRDWKRKHLDSRIDFKVAYERHTCRFPKYVTNDEHEVYEADENRIPAPLPASDPNGDNIVFDNYGDYNAYANNAPSVAVSYDTQQSLCPQASSSASQAQSYYPATTIGIHQSGQYSSTTGSAPQNEQYYPVSSSGSQGRGYTNETRNSGSGHHHRRGDGSSRRG
ncbi:uncharacterized protein EAE97_009830 [Botrytis byssoidea]|uniref:Uncharacterized protein n=1 Tax=Botrytis byssoidea TaxID=139641 RepID=A0A9P5I4D5_9HELO|nr:uncharacterized protein EAE97_009830 [Botrytis byssoidea]KAF7928032.1 hypothetical protein EAE97_009830 [Botrytis byssoidea]